MHVLQTRKPRLSSARWCDIAELTDVRLLLCVSPPTPTLDRSGGFPVEAGKLYAIAVGASQMLVSEGFSFPRASRT